MSKKKQRTTRRLDEPQADAPAVGEAQGEATPVDAASEVPSPEGQDTGLTKLTVAELDTRAAELDAREDALSTLDAELMKKLKASQEPEAEPKGADMLTTENMPDAEPVAKFSELGILIIEPSEPGKMRFFKGAQLGKCNRAVLAAGEEVHPHMKKNITFEPGKVYTIEFKHGRALVPTIIADYIADAGPGGNLRLI